MVPQNGLANWAVSRKLAAGLTFFLAASTVILPTPARSAASPMSTPTRVLSTGAVLYPFGALKAKAVWSKSGWTKTKDKPIDVCWENLTQSPAALRLAVQDAVAQSWAFYGMLTFQGWGQCTATSKGIRIGIGTTSSETSGLGQELDGKQNGMVLQMDFTAFEFCKTRNEFCVRATAVHEFGHALGFTHEQNRSDSPSWCKAKHQGDYPDQVVTDYDPKSIMNYCNPAWNNNGILSDMDIVAVTTVYGGRA